MPSETLIRERQERVLDLELTAIFKAADMTLTTEQFAEVKRRLSQVAAIAFYDSTKKRHGYNSNWGELESPDPNTARTPEESMLAHS